MVCFKAMFVSAAFLVVLLVLQVTISGGAKSLILSSSCCACLQTRMRSAHHDLKPWGEVDQAGAEVCFSLFVSVCKKPL